MACIKLGTVLRFAGALSFVSAPAFGFALEGSQQVIFVGAGLAFQDAGRTAVDDTGDTSLTSSSLVSFTLAGRFKLNQHWGLSPVLSYTPFGASGADTGEKTTLVTFDLRAYRELGAFDVHAGPGALFDKISGSGGTSTLSNGNSTAVFGLPSGSSTSRFLYLEAGLGVTWDRFRMDLDFLVTDTFSTRRAVDPFLTASVGLF